MNDASRLLASRSLRGLVDGMVSLVMAGYLARVGLSTVQIGIVVTATLLGSAFTTLLAGFAADRLSCRRILHVAALLMVLTGLGFGFATEFRLLLLVAFVGTFNPSGGDVSLFLPTEQAALSRVVPADRRTAIFARYNVLGSVGAALGAWLGGLAVSRAPVDILSSERAILAVYALTGLIVLALFAGLSPQIESPNIPNQAPLARSRRTVFKLAALFSLDSFGGGFVVQSLLVLWLERRFGIAPGAAGLVFLAAGVLSAAGQLLAAPLAARIGLVPTMVFTHLPANVFLILAGLAPSAPLAIGFLLARAALSSMDVPARQAYVMSVVPPEERAAAASVTNVPRSLTAAIPPLFVGWLLARTSFGWPLIIAGVLKAIYDLLLLAALREPRSLEHPPPAV
jgi:MFS family permease